MINQNNYKLYAFMRAARGNWHNALYVECDCNHCSHHGDGFLFAADADGKPLLIPVSTFQTFAGESIAPDECQATLPRHTFESIYSLYLEWHTVSDADCLLRQMFDQTTK